jgi:hypothetical protein
MDHGMSQQVCQPPSVLIVGLVSFSVLTRVGLTGFDPGFSEIGDLVYLLYGGHVLYVLREKNQTFLFEFVGECYIHGVIDREALNSPTPQKEFVIV